jgi:Cu-Zn family superoxide dismutase
LREKTQDWNHLGPSPRGYNRGMRTTLRNSFLLTTAILALCAFGMAKDNVKVAVKDPAGKTVGWAMVSGTSQGVHLKLTLDHMPPGEHAVHFHSVAKCEGPDFKSAGPHFNPEGKQHGLQNPDGHHAGDMDNFTVDAKGKASVELFNKDVNLGSDSHSLFSNGGTAIVVHAKADDMRTDPSGNSGDRIACGVISK